MQITELPFNQLIGIEQSIRPGAYLSLRGEQRYTNHLGTVHASALLALAEASSGEYLIRELGDPGFEVIPVVRRVEAKFKKPAYGEVYSTVEVAEEVRDRFLSTLKTKGRAIISVAVSVFDERETHALTVVVEWFVSKMV